MTSSPSWEETINAITAALAAYVRGRDQLVADAVAARMAEDSAKVWAAITEASALVGEIKGVAHVRDAGPVTLEYPKK
ncbi:MAG: hypothetical protein V4515_01820 [Chloroflexota bacterium]